RSSTSGSLGGPDERTGVGPESYTCTVREQTAYSALVVSTRGRLVGRLQRGALPNALSNTFGGDDLILLEETRGKVLAETVADTSLRRHAKQELERIPSLLSLDRDRALLADDRDCVVLRSSTRA